MTKATATEGEPFGRYRLLEKPGQRGSAETRRAADAADAADVALRRDLDRVIGVDAEEKKAAPVAGVAKVRQDVGACLAGLACLDSMGLP